jgi:hypothetical protein
MMHLLQLVRLSAEVLPMQSLWRPSLAAGLAVAIAALLPTGPARGQDKAKEVTFKTADGVTLSGNFYAAGGKKQKDAVVMLLHDFDHKNGGGSKKGGWPTLAKALQDAGYAVLSFDFRGFGDSREVNKEVFWDTRKFPYNTPLNIRRKGAKVPESIDHKDFTGSYYAYLVNDVAAAKAFLDRANDRKECNSSSVLIVGAGQGATLGAMWVANECYRRKDKNKNNLVVVPDLAGEPEVKDVAGCVWLTVSPQIETRSVGTQLRGTWVTAAVKTNKVPMAFYYGKNDSKGYNTSSNIVKSLKAAAKGAQVQERAIEGSSSIGSKLLDGPTNRTIIKDLDAILESRGPREQKDKKSEDSAFYYVTNPKAPRPVINKKAGDEVPPVNAQMLLGQ